MDEKKRIEEIKEGLKKSVYQEAERIKIVAADSNASTARLSNILEGYMDRIDTMEAENMQQLEEELKVLKNQDVEVGSIEERDQLIKQYNDYIHNDLERTIAQTQEYSINFGNKTDDLKDILIRPMHNENINIEEATVTPKLDNKIDTDELFEIEATTDLSVLDDIVNLESDTLDIAGTTITSYVKVGEDEFKINQPEKVGKKTIEEKSTIEKENSKKVRKNINLKPDNKKYSKMDLDFDDGKKLATLDYLLIGILIIIIVAIIILVAKLNGAFA